MILDVNEICSDINSDLTGFIHNIIVIIKIAVPIILVIFGMIDLGKGVVANKEDEIKKGQGVFIKRLIAGVIVFFMVTIAQLVTNIVDKENNGQFWECANTIMNGETYIDDKSSDDNTSKNGQYKKCCINFYNGTYSNGVCTDDKGNMIDSDELARNVLSGNC